MYANSTDRVCYLCNPECLTCQFNSSYCYSCDTSLGYAWLNFSCLSSCPTPYFLSNSSANCTICSNHCQSCSVTATNCSICTLSGTYKAYLNGNSCVVSCPAGTYGSTVGGANLCISCDARCLACTSSPSPCSSCAPTYYLYSSECVSVCPDMYFADDASATCLSCDISCVSLTMSMYFPNSIHDVIYVDMVFSQNMDFSTFPYTSFQSFSINSDMYSMNMLSIVYEVLNTSSYRIVLQPKGYIFLYNATITCQVMDLLSPVHKSATLRPFKTTNYGISSSLLWLVIKAPEMSSG